MLEPTSRKNTKCLQANRLAHLLKDRENFLIGMMKVNYLKRLESSIKSFEISIGRTVEKIEALESKIGQFKLNHTQTSPLESFSPDEDELDEDDLEALQVGKKLKFDLADLDLDRWLVDLKSDKAALAHIVVQKSSVL